MNSNSLKNLKPWQPGQTGNPHGRPISSRNRLTEQFLKDTSETWSRHGARILEEMATNESFRFADLCGRLIPRDVQLSLSARLPGDMEPGDWQIALEVFGAVKSAIPNASNRPPGEVLEFVADAIRAHGAKLVEG